MASLYLIWQENGTVLTGQDSSGNWINNNETFAINYPGNMTEAHILNVYSSAQINKTYNTLINVKLYLTGDAESLQIVQEFWPILGNGYVPFRTNLNGGFEISFDGGSNYTRFSTSVGYQQDPSTWITLPAISVGINGQDGVLGAFDIATLIVRFVIPPGSVEFQKLNIGLALDFDVI
jgi:hypothetical protein